jgi:hypothetical protein
MGEIARKAIEELERSSERKSPHLIYLEETREDFHRQFSERLRNIVPGFDPAAAVRERRRLRPLKRVPVKGGPAFPAESLENAPPQD